MIATTAREYLNARIKACDSDFEEWCQAYTQDHVPDTNIDCYYHILFQEVTSTENSIEFSEDQLSIELSFWKHGYECTTDALQEFLDKVHCLRNDIISPINWVSPLIRVSSSSIINQPVVGNDSIIEAKVQLTFEVSYCLIE